jgi:hypothetical protein
MIKRGSVSPHPEWRIVVEMLSGRDYNTEISHTELSDATGLRHGSSRYFSQIRKARRVLLADWQRELESMPGLGYRLVTPSEFGGRARREIVISGRRIRTAKSILVAAPQHLLSDHDNAKNADALSKFGALEAHRLSALKSTRPSLPPPRADVPKMLGGAPS